MPAETEKKKYKIYNMLIKHLFDEEQEHNPKSYKSMSNANNLPYQAYERINIKGLRWSVEKRINEYNLKPLFNKDASVLDIGSNSGFIANEFALFCKFVHGIEPVEKLNEIARLVSVRLGLDNTKFFTSKFEDFENKINYDLVLSFASFHTSDENQRTSAEYFFSKVSNYMKKNALFFYESVSYQKKQEEPDYPFYLAKEEAISVCREKFDILSIKETKSGSKNYRTLALMKKKNF